MTYVEIAELVFITQDRFSWVGEGITTDEQFCNLNGTDVDGEKIYEYESSIVHREICNQVMHILLIAAMEGEL